LGGVCSEVIGAEKVGERLGDLFGRVDVAVQHPAAELLRRGVDEFDLVRFAHDPVRGTLANLRVSNAFDRVRDVLEMLDIEGRDDIDPGIEQLEYVFATLLVSARTRHVGMCKLVDEHDLRLPTEHSVEIHLLEHRATMLDHPTRDDLEICQARLSHRSTVAFHDADHDVRTAVAASMTLVEHRDGLPDAASGSEIDTELTGDLDQVPDARRPHILQGMTGDFEGRVRKPRLSGDEVAKNLGTTEIGANEYLAHCHKFPFFA
jgi:hypothetical protein